MIGGALLLLAVGGFVAWQRKPPARPHKPPVVPGSELAVKPRTDLGTPQTTPGTCRGIGTISFYGNVLVEKESETIELPEIDLGAGIPIAP